MKDLPKSPIRVEYEGLDIYTNAMFSGSPRYRAATDGLIKQDIGKAKQLSQRFAPRKTGNLRDAIKTKRFGDMHYMLYVDKDKADYGIYMELGTRAHIIRARRAKVLRWYVGGKPVFAKQVRHPGTKPYLFVKRGVKSAFTGFTSRLKKAHITVFKRLGGK